MVSFQEKGIALIKRICTLLKQSYTATLNMVIRIQVTMISLGIVSLVDLRILALVVSV